MSLFFFLCMFQLLLYVFLTCLIIITVLIASHNIIVVPDFKGPCVRAGKCTSPPKRGKNSDPSDGTRHPFSVSHRISVEIRLFFMYGLD
jgi:hypothetical protein